MWASRAVAKRHKDCDNIARFVYSTYNVSRVKYNNKGKVVAPHGCPRRKLQHQDACSQTYAPSHLASCSSFLQATLVSSQPNTFTTWHACAMLFSSIIIMLEASLLATPSSRVVRPLAPDNGEQVAHFAADTQQRDSQQKAPECYMQSVTQASAPLFVSE